MKRQRDIDAIRRALRPRMDTARIAAAVAPSTTIPVHTHPACVITFVPAGNLAGDDVQEVAEELDSEKLARDGTQTMLGALDMDSNSISNADDMDVEGTATVAEDVVFTGAAGLAKLTDVRALDFESGAVGEAIISNARALTFKDDAVAEAQISNARQIHLVGDNVDGEARIDGVEWIEFNEEPTKSVISNPSRLAMNVAVDPTSDFTPSEGEVSWHSGERALVDFVVSGDEIVAVAVGWDVHRCIVEPEYEEG